MTDASETKTKELPGGEKDKKLPQISHSKCGPFYSDIRTLTQPSLG